MPAVFRQKEGANAFPQTEYSLFSQFSKIILLIYGLFVVSFSLIFLFLNHNMQSNLYDSYCRTIDYCLSGIKNDLEIANRSVLSTLYNNSDLSELSCSNNILNISVCESSLQRTLNSYLLCYSTVDGLFFFTAAVMTDLYPPSGIPIPFFLSISGI